MNVDNTDSFHLDFNAYSLIIQICHFRYKIHFHTFTFFIIIRVCAIFFTKNFINFVAYFYHSTQIFIGMFPIYMPNSSTKNANCL